jgi:hypothetical protein
LNPVFWVARRERHRQAFVWVFLGAYLAAWLACNWFLPRLWASPLTIVAAGSILHTVFKLWLAMESTRRLAADKRNGVLELLLVTPLEVPAIIRGLIAGLKRQFLLPFVVVAGVDLLLLLFAMGRVADPKFPLMCVVGMGLFIADSYTLIWVGLWQGLSSKEGTHAFIRTILMTLVGPSILYVALGGMVFVSGASPDLLLAFWFGVGYVADFALALSANASLSEFFRLAATGVPEERRATILPRFRRLHRNEAEPLAGDFSLFSDPS